MKQGNIKWGGRMGLALFSILAASCGVDVSSLESTSLPQPEVQVVAEEPQATLPVAELPQTEESSAGESGDGDGKGIVAPELGFYPGDINLRATNPADVQLGTGPQLVEMFAFW